MNNINNINNVNKYIDITTGKQFSTGGKSYHIQHHNTIIQPHEFPVAIVKITE